MSLETQVGALVTASNALTTEVQNKMTELVDDQQRRNFIINGDRKINQREFNGDWSALSVGDYAYDMFKKSAVALSKEQIIEDGSYVYSATYTVSGTGMTTAQLTAPASGHFTVTFPEAATDMKVELGSVATPFIPDHQAVSLAKCQRYLKVWRGVDVILPYSLISDSSGLSFSSATPTYQDMRITPSVSFIGVWLTTVELTHRTIDSMSIDPASGNFTVTVSTAQNPNTAYFITSHSSGNNAIYVSSEL